MGLDAKDEEIASLKEQLVSNAYQSSIDLADAWKIAFMSSLDDNMSRCKSCNLYNMCPMHEVNDLPCADYVKESK